MIGLPPEFDPLPRSFFLRPPDQVAPALLGKLVVRRAKGELLAGRIVETEAYFGVGDPAAHAWSGRTERNGVLFGPPGHAYVYFIYGMHWCLNVSCEPEGKAGSVLLRALEPVTGLEAMARHRGLASPVRPKLLTSGPGRLCSALGITRGSHNGADLTDSAGDLYLADDGFRPHKIEVTPRIGISRAAEMPARYVIAGNGFVSGARSSKSRGSMAAAAG